MKKRILLLNPPYPQPIIRDNYCCFTSKSGYQWAPTDLLYISGILNKNRLFLVNVIDAPAERLSVISTYEKITHLNPDIICCLTGTVSFEQDMKLLKKYKSLHKKTKLYVLGNTPTFAPKRFLTQFPFIDGVLHNFMDRSIVNVFMGKPHLCKTCSYFKKGQVKIGHINFDNKTVIAGIKAPQYHLFPIKNYSSPLMKKTPFITAITAFGCPFTCSFCIASRLNYQTRDLSELQNEFLSMKKNGINEIAFLDSTFNANPPYVTSILKMMIEKNFQFSWSAQIHSFRVTPELINMMKRAGCHTVQIGIESGNKEILRKYAPSKIDKNIIKAVEICKKAGVRTLGYYIIGFPNETKKQVLETILHAKNLNPDFASFSIMTPDYGTKVYEDSLGEQMFTDGETVPLSSFDSSGRAIIHNRNISLKEQDNLIRKAYIDFYLRPKKLFFFLIDFSLLIQHIKNGLFLISKEILNK